MLSHQSNIIRIYSGQESECDNNDYIIAGIRPLLPIFFSSSRRTFLGRKREILAYFVAKLRTFWRTSIPYNAVAYQKITNIRYDDSEGRVRKLYFAKNQRQTWKETQPMVANNKTNVSILTLSLKILQPGKNLSPWGPMNKFSKGNHLVSLVTIGYLIAVMLKMPMETKNFD